MLEPGSAQPSPEQAQAPAPEQPSQEADPIISALRSDPSKLDSIIASLPDDLINKVPAFNKRMDQFVTKKSAELKEEQRKRDAERQEQERKTQQDRFVAQQFANQIESMSAADRGNLFVQQPELAVRYKQSKDFLNQHGRANENAVAERIWNNARKALETKYEVKLDSANTLEEAMELINENTVNTRVKEIEKSFEEKLTALRAELTGQVARVGSQPERHASQGVAGGKRTYTGSEIERMSLDEYRANAADIDLARKEGRIK